MTTSTQEDEQECVPVYQLMKLFSDEWLTVTQEKYTEVIEENIYPSGFKKARVICNHIFPSIQPQGNMTNNDLALIIENTNRLLAETVRDSDRYQLLFEQFKYLLNEQLRRVLESK